MALRARMPCKEKEPRLGKREGRRDTASTGWSKPLKPPGVYLYLVLRSRARLGAGSPNTCPRTEGWKGKGENRNKTTRSVALQIGARTRGKIRGPTESRRRSWRTTGRVFDGEPGWSGADGGTHPPAAQRMRSTSVPYLKAGPHEAVQPGRSDPVLGLTRRAPGEFRGEAYTGGRRRGAPAAPPDLAWRGLLVRGPSAHVLVHPCELVHGAQLVGRANPARATE